MHSERITVINRLRYIWEIPCSLLQGSSIIQSLRQIRSVRGALGSLFSFATQNTPKPVTAPKVDMALRTGTKNTPRCGEIATWGCSITCIDLVPFHDL
jgi:hypothetical protein